MIRFLDAAGLPTAIYAVDLDGQRYTPEEIAAIGRAQQSEGFVTPLQNPESNERQERRCAVVGCEKPVFAQHSFCTMHRLRMQRTGDPALARKRGPKKKEG